MERTLLVCVGTRWSIGCYTGWAWSSGNETLRRMIWSPLSRPSAPPAGRAFELGCGTGIDSSTSPPVAGMSPPSTWCLRHWRRPPGRVDRRVTPRFIEGDVTRPTRSRRR
jgi:hypothetical protein